MVKARGNIFFNINAANITITSSCSANGTSFTPAIDVTGIAGSSALDLSLSPVYGTAVSISGSLATTDPASNLTLLNTNTNSCAGFNNVYLYDAYRFTPSVTGTYTFTRSTGSSSDIFNLYSDKFDPSNACSNFITSSGRYNGTSASIVNSYTATLNAGLYYTMAVGSFNNGGTSPTFPDNYTITATGPGTLFSNTPSPGSGFNYTYVIVDNTTGLIKAIDASANLSNASNYPAGGNYTVYGLSYSNTISAATLNAYAGTSFTSFRNDLLYNPATLCGSVSLNNIDVTVTAVLFAKTIPLNVYKKGNTVNLKWTATTEQSSSYFEIWRSANGNDYDVLVGRAAAKGNESSSVGYELNDYSPLSTWNYYRVKQVDADGNSTWGSVARVNMQQEQTTLSVYPNPVKASLTLDYLSASVETVGVRVLNSTGNLVYQSRFTAQNGPNQYKVPVGALPQGIYIVQLVSGSGSVTARFVKE